MTFLHCRNCSNKVPKGESPRGWARLEIAIGDGGIEVNCVRCEMEVLKGTFDHLKEVAASMNSYCEKCEGEHSEH